MAANFAGNLCLSDSAKFKFAHAKIFVFLALFAFAFASSAWSQTSTSPETELPPLSHFGARPMDGGAVLPYQEFSEKIRAAEMVTPLTSELFGDSVSLYNRQTEFSNVDIDIPGNNALPVQLRRRFVVAPIDRSAMADPFGGMANWDIDVPYISGVFDAYVGWGGRGLTQTVPRCSDHYIPDVRTGFDLDEIWSGTSVHIPGKGDRELMGFVPARYPGIPDASTAHHWGTSERETFYCKSTTANGYPGESFVMVSPDGLKYFFDWGVERTVPAVQRGTVSNSRVRVYLLASRIEDRYGNHVDFSYDGDGKPNGKLEAIRGYDRSGAADGRVITLNWVPGAVPPRLLAATKNPGSPDQSRTWSYFYNTFGTDTNQRLSSVTLPDASAWIFDYPGDYLYVNRPASDAGDGPNCIFPESVYPNSNFILNVTHPSGATGKFEFAMQRHAREGVPKNQCVFAPFPPGSIEPPNSTPHYRIVTSPFADVYSLERKTLTGAGIPAGTLWTYETVGSAPLPRWWHGSTVPCTDCTDRKTVKVTNPDGSATAYQFGIVYGLNEGKLLQTDQLAVDGSVLRSEATDYICGNNSTTVPCQMRYGLQLGSVDPSAGEIWAVREKRVLQQGVTLKRTNLSFDGLARPLMATLTGTDNERNEQTVYEDITNKWVLGLVSSVTNTNANQIMVQNDYDADGNLERVTNFGKTTREMVWNADGTLWTVNDGDSAHVTTLGSFKRGIPQSVLFSDGGSQTAVVDDLGQIKSVTERTNTSEYATTSYDYDPIGRLTTITPPTRAGGTPWNPTTISYPSTSSAEVGMTGLHWKQITSTGDATTGYATKTLYFDAMWRPVVTEEQDSTSGQQQSRYVRRTVDYNNRETFVSYPSATLPSNAPSSPGMRTEYDALGRISKLKQNAEQGGVLETTTTYDLNELAKTVRDPRFHDTRTTFWALENPSEDAPATITMPEGVTVTIGRDTYGKVLNVTRQGSYLGVPQQLTRTYVYDPNQRLCKTIEPESGATILSYDAANNVDWSVKGSSLNSTLDCNRTNVPASERTKFTYDARNHLESTTYPLVSNTSSVTQTWYPDGKLKTATTNGATWTYAYNSRRLLETETLAYDNKSFRTDWVWSVPLISDRWEV